MALPAANDISLSNVNTELTYSATAMISMNDAALRALFGQASGAVDMNTGHGKSNAWTGTITTNQQQLNLATWAAANGWNGSSYAIITIAANVYIWSDSLSIAALTTGYFPNGVKIINNGFIMGKGGDGSGTNAVSGSSGETFAAGTGGPAISLGSSTTIDNTSATGYIGGGGGGGATGYPVGVITGGSVYAPLAGGGGAGGGRGGQAALMYGSLFMTGWAAGGTIGATGANGALHIDGPAGGGAGGRIMPGVGGNGQTVTTTSAAEGYGGGAGGAGALYGYGGFSTTGGNGGSGGNAGNDGFSTKTSAGTMASGGGGGWGAVGGRVWTDGNLNYALNLPGAGGKAVVLNGNSLTWTSGNTTRVYGAVA